MIFPFFIKRLYAGRTSHTNHCFLLNFTVLKSVPAPLNRDT